MSVLRKCHAGMLEIGNTGPKMPMAQKAILLSFVERK